MKKTTSTSSEKKTENKDAPSKKDLFICQAALDKLVQLKDEKDMATITVTVKQAEYDGALLQEMKRLNVKGFINYGVCLDCGKITRSSKGPCRCTMDGN